LVFHFLWGVWKCFPGSRCATLYDPVFVCLEPSLCGCMYNAYSTNSHPPCMAFFTKHFVTFVFRSFCCFFFPGPPYSDIRRTFSLVLFPGWGSGQSAIVFRFFNKKCFSFREALVKFCWQNLNPPHQADTSSGEFLYFDQDSAPYGRPFPLCEIFPIGTLFFSLGLFYSVPFLVSPRDCFVSACSPTSFSLAIYESTPSRLPFFLHPGSVRANPPNLDFSGIEPWPFSLNLSGLIPPKIWVWFHWLLPP